MMDEKQIVKHALDDYQRITGLRSYIVEDNTVIQSASEKNYFCKCLKISSKALEKCEECTKETYENARQIDKECIYSCHAGLIKWAVPVNYKEYHCVIVSEGILAQTKRRGRIAGQIISAVNINLMKICCCIILRIIKTMDESEMNASIQLLKVF